MESFVQGLVLGIVQGITEWLPVSSEGINTLIQSHFFKEPLAEAIRMSLWLHAGTLIAAVLYFRKDITKLLRHLPQLQEVPRVRLWEATGPLVGVER